MEARIPQGGGRRGRGGREQPPPPGDRAAKGRAKEERAERAELAPFGLGLRLGRANRADIHLFDDDGP